MQDSSQFSNSPLLLAGTDDHALQRSRDRARSAADGRIELDPIGGDHLAAIERRSAGAGDLPAEPSFHDAFVIALLALGEYRLSVSSHIRHARHPARNVSASAPLPNEVTCVKATMLAVLIEYGHQAVDFYDAFQQMGGVRVAGRVRRSADFQLVRRL